MPSPDTEYAKQIAQIRLQDARLAEQIEESRLQDAERSKQSFFKEPRLEVDEIARAVIGAAIEVHRHLGPGHIETMYERALAIELDVRGISYERQVSTELAYKGILVGEFRVDLVVGGAVIVELKAVESLSATHVKQVLSYLKLTGLELALLLNFNVPVLKDGIKRLIPKYG